MINKKLSTWALSIALSTTVSADLGDKIERNWDKSTGTSKVYTGANNTSFDIGLSHERRKGSIGVDALAFYSSENDTAGAGQHDSQTLLGSSLLYHLHDDSSADVFLGTGLAVVMHDDVNGTTENDTTFGPLFRIGSSYYLNRDWSVGLEYLVAMNWTDDSLTSQSNYGFLSLGYTY